MARAASLAPAVRPKLGQDALLMRLLMAVIGLYLVVTLALPLYAMLSKSVQDKDGTFIGLANYARYFATPALSHSIWNSLSVALLTTAITVTLAFVFAYALSRSCVPAKGLFKSIAMMPILVPSLLPGIALIYLFGNQGMIKGLMFGHSIYGPIGIVIAEVFFTLPHALIIILTALSIADARLYEAAIALRATKPRIFLTVTLPGVRYGLISAAFVVFTLAFTDFGAPKVIGGNFNVLATDVYKQVIGQQNFQMGAVVSMVLLIPAAVAFAVDRLVQKRQVALLSARAVPLAPEPNRRFDLADAGLRPAGQRLHPRHSRHLPVRRAGQVLPVQSRARAQELRLRPHGRRRLGVLLQLDRDGGSTPPSSAPIVIFLGAYVVEKARGFEKGPRAVPAARDAADGGAGPGARARLHLLLQRAEQPAQRHLSHDDHPGDLDHHPLLHRGASDRGDRAQADGPGVRGGLGLAQAALLQDPLAGHDPGLPACRSSTSRSICSSTR